jgi:5-enolpyruvylshikimate-3-phosphate synthase
MIVVILGLAGAVSLGALDLVVNERMHNRPIPRYVRYLRLVSICLFGAGIGFFLSIVVEGRVAKPPHVVAKQVPPAKSQELKP